MSELTHTPSENILCLLRSERQEFFLKRFLRETSGITFEHQNWSQISQRFLDDTFMGFVLGYQSAEIDLLNAKPETKNGQ